MRLNEYQRKKMRKIYIGIDPDLKKCGFAKWFKESKTIEVYLRPVHEIIIYLSNYSTSSQKDNLTVIIEAGWLNKKSNFRGTQNKAIGERIAKNVGENHASGKIIEQACQELGITYRLVKPTTSKTTPAYFEKLTGIKTKNQEMIDAGMLVYEI